MNLAEAWQTLGRDPDRVFATIESFPREKRVEIAMKIAEKARRMAGKLSAPHHPDKGGKPEEYRKYWEALEIIEKSTAEFQVLLEEKKERDEERASKETFMIRI